MKYNKIIFVDKNGTSRALMASLVFKREWKNWDCKICAKGILVAFSEPANPLAEAVLASDGINIGTFSSKKLQNEDITESTIVFAVEESIKEGIIARYENANESNTFEMCDYSGVELKIMNPYGGTLTSYGICYESIKNVVSRLVEVMEDQNE